MPSASPSITPSEVPLDALWPPEVNNGSRQVYAALYNVALQVCEVCPFFDATQGGGLNVHGQPGICTFGRSQANGRTGQASCIAV